MTKNLLIFILSLCSAQFTLGQAGCTNSQACNYDPGAITDDNSCLLFGSPCDDMNSSTWYDHIDENCNCTGYTTAINCGDDIFISEYVEGSLNNKAIELFNPTAEPIDLSLGQYKFGRDRDGSGNPMLMNITGIVPPFGTRVFVLDKRDLSGTDSEIPVDLSLAAVADTFVNPIYVQSASPFYYNGDDAFVLIKGTMTILDIIGKVGQDPGLGWSDPNDPTNTPLTTDHTLRRKPFVYQGLSSNPTVFNPTVEWDVFPNDTFDGLGWHVINCTELVIGCTDPNSCNYSAAANYNNANCIVIGSPCDDGNDETTNDQYLEGCMCQGEVVINNGGCTNVEACNFDASAEFDDGSCAFIGDPCDDGNPETGNDIYNVFCSCMGVMSPGCIDPMACNFNAEATVDDGTCLYTGEFCSDGNNLTFNDVIGADCICSGTLIVLGCTNVGACNYNAAANTEDWSCLFTGDDCNDGNEMTMNDLISLECTCEGILIVEGCTNPAACNYNPEANVDNGLCLFGDAGCTDVLACNYSSQAVCDNGTCLYLSQLQIEGEQSISDTEAEYTYNVIFDGDGTLNWSISPLDAGIWTSNFENTNEVSIIWQNEPLTQLCVQQIIEQNGVQLCAGEEFCIDIDFANGVESTWVEKVNVYPNPSSEKLILSGVKNWGNLSIDIFNSQAQKVQAVRINNATIDISMLSDGLYFLRLSNADSFTTIQFVKN